MTTITIKIGERGVLRVFAINKPIPDMARAVKNNGQLPCAMSLLQTSLLPNGAEVFPVSDLSDMGLSGYLVQGYAIPQSQIIADRGRLDGLDGFVLLLFSSAFDGDATLTLGPDLTLIGTYREPQPDQTGPAPTSAAAAPYTGPARTATPPTSTRRPTGSAFVFAGFALVALALWLFLR